VCGGGHRGGGIVEHYKRGFNNPPFRVHSQLYLKKPEVVGDVANRNNDQLQRSVTRTPGKSPNRKVSRIQLWGKQKTFNLGATKGEMAIQKCPSYENVWGNKPTNPTRPPEEKLTDRKLGKHVQFRWRSHLLCGGKK